MEKEKKSTQWGRGRGRSRGDWGYV